MQPVASPGQKHRKNDRRDRLLRLLLSLGALVAGVVSAVVLAGIESQSRLKLDAVMASIFLSFLAIGTTLVTVLPGANRIDVIHILFGNILGSTGAI